MNGLGGLIQGELKVKDPLILYDGICRFCTASVRFVVKRDTKKHFKFSALQSALGKKILNQLNLPHDTFKTFIVVSAGRYYTKSSAALQVVKRLDGLWPLLFVCVLVPRPIRDLIYDGFAGRRYRLFGKHNSCFVPEGDITDRFLD